MAIRPAAARGIIVPLAEFANAGNPLARGRVRNAPPLGASARVGQVMKFGVGFVISVAINHQAHSFGAPPLLWQRSKARTFNILHWTI